MQHWNWRQRSLATVLWPAFLAACAGTLLFFATVDATRLTEAFVFNLPLSDRAVYSVGFLFFWFVALIASGLSTLLLRTERRRADFPTPPNDNATASNAED